MRILFLSRWYPYPPNNGSKLRINNLLDNLLQHHEVQLISFFDPLDNGKGQLDSPPSQLNVEMIPYKILHRDLLQDKLDLFHSTPRDYLNAYSLEMKNCIEHSLRRKSFDLIVASQIDTAAYVQSFAGYPALFEEVEVGFMHDQFANASTPSRRIRYKLTWMKYRRYLEKLLHQFRAGTVVSEEERTLLQRAVPDFKSVSVIPNCVNLEDYSRISEQPEPGKIVFTGSFSFYPNYEAIQWFLNDVFPRIVERVPEAKLYISGDHRNYPLPGAYNIVLTGFIENVHSLVASSWVSIAPIMRGGGTRLKILEAMALRTPVVATSKGAEGLDVSDGEHLLIADEPDKFADMVIRLLLDPGLRRRLSENAYQLIEEKYNWAVVMPKFLDLLDHVVSA
jgi:polysaccharide biosynthesis protein PslH